MIVDYDHENLEIDKGHQYFVSRGAVLYINYINFVFLL
jgi:hypothetical protein